MPDTIVATFGDMIRVPGTESSLEQARAEGADVRVVYSPSNALDLAKRSPDTQVVFLGVGFETTAPMVAWSVKKAAEDNVTSYSVLCAHKLIPPAMAALLQSGELNIDGFLCPGHVSVVIGVAAYEFICDEYGIPCVVAGFEPQDMAASIEMLLQQLSEERAEVEIQYKRSVGGEGNTEALRIMDEVLAASDSEWRGLGVIPGSGLSIRKGFAASDARLKYTDIELPEPGAEGGCICGEVLRGVKTPLECLLFRTRCTPSTPVGACMVSSEGTCAAYYKYSKRLGE